MKDLEESGEWRVTSGERVGGQKIKELGERRCCGTCMKHGNFLEVWQMKDLEESGE